MSDTNFEFNRLRSLFVTISWGDNRRQRPDTMDLLVNTTFEMENTMAATYSLPNKTFCIASNGTPARIMVEPQTTIEAMVEGRDLVFSNSEGRFWTALTMEEFTTHNNEIQEQGTISGSIRCPNWYQHNLSMTAQESLYMLAYHLGKRQCTTENNCAILVSWEADLHNAAVHTIAGKASWFSRGYNSVQYQVVAPSRYTLSNKERSTLSILKLNNYKPMKPLEQFTWDRGFVWASHIPMEIVRYAHDNYAQAQPHLQVGLSQAITTMGIEALSYMSDNVAMSVVRYASHNGVDLKSNQWHRQGMAQFILGHPQCVNCVATANAESLTKARSLDNEEEQQANPNKRLRLEITVNPQGGYNVEQMEEVRPSHDLTSPGNGEDAAMEAAPTMLPDRAAGRN